jgi:hypothetical protein
MIREIQDPLVLVGILGRGRCIDDPRLHEARIDDRASRNLQND